MPLALKVENGFISSLWARFKIVCKGEAAETLSGASGCFFLSPLHCGQLESIFFNPQKNLTSASSGGKGKVYV